MPSKHVSLPGGGSAIICTTRGRRPIICSVCGCKGDRLCDFVLAQADHHVLPRTCDKPLCTRCAHRAGRGVDYCPDHPRQQPSLGL